MWELSKAFRFEAAHALSGTSLGTTSEEIHGHSYRAEVVVRGVPDPTTGMLIDVGRLEERISTVRLALDHRLLNRVVGLGPPTLENLARFIWNQLEDVGPIVRVSVHRDSCGESCAYFGTRTS